MPLQVLQHPNWHGTPLNSVICFASKGNRREARAALLPISSGGDPMLVGSQLEVEEWKQAMIEKGWS